MKVQDRRYIRRVYAVVSCALVVSLSFVLFSLPVSANDDVAQVTKPILEPSITKGDLRNTQTITLRINSETAPRYSSIQVLDKDNKVLRIDDKNIRVRDTNGLKSIQLTWDTRATTAAEAYGDGDYKIRYSAAISRDQSYSEIYDVRVRNNQPLVTIANSEKGRKVSGFVSRSDVEFRVFVDEKSVQVSPSFALEPDQTGMTAWSFTLPNSIADGTRRVSIEVLPKIDSGGRWSDPVVTTIKVTTPAVTIPVKPAPIEPALPPLGLAPAIGQFIAPAIPQLEHRTRTMFYGMPVSDITQNVQGQSSYVLGGSDTTVLGVQSDKDDDTAVAIVASATGWKFFGLEWYWPAIFGVLAIATFLTYKWRQASPTKQSAFTQL